MRKAAGALMAVISLGGSLWASPIEEARQALEDGLPQVTILKLQAQKKWANPAEQTAADLLLGEALFAAGRYEEAVNKLAKLANREPAAKFWLAESFSALGQPAKALSLYQDLAGDEQFASRAAIGSARMLVVLDRTPEALSILSKRVDGFPKDEAAALELASQSLDANDLATATKALAGVQSESARANYLRGRVLLSQGEVSQASAVLNLISEKPARLAAGIAITKAECAIRLKELEEAEKTLESFIEDNAALPGLAPVFAALDRVYGAQTSASSTELRRWAADGSELVRAGFATFYLARNEARSGDAERARQLYQDFLTKYPGNPLGQEARSDLAESLLADKKPDQALAVLEDEKGGRVSFIRGKALASLGRYQEAAASFSDAAKQDDLERDALANAALCAMLAGTPDEKNDAARKLRALPSSEAAVDRFEFLSAMHRAAQRDPGAAKKLSQVAGSGSSYAAQARLALAEWEALQLDFPAARADLKQISNDQPKNPVVDERAAALAVFVADTGEPDADAKVKLLAAEFLKTYPDSAFAGEIHMKLGEMYFRRGDYLAARGQFVEITEKFSDSPLAEKAVFLTARAMERSMDPETMGEAIKLYEDIAKAGGPLAQRARLAQAMLFSALKKPKDALNVLDRILESKPDAELRNTALIEAGDTLFAEGETDPSNYQKAIEVWKKLAGDSTAPRMWSNQALFKIGTAYEKLNQPDAALDAFYSVVSRGPSADNREPEYFWYYKAGFEAGTLLANRKLWKEAIAIYEKLGSVDGPRAGEAQDRVRKLRLANFIWED